MMSSRTKAHADGRMHHADAEAGDPLFEKKRTKAH